MTTYRVTVTPTPGAPGTAVDRETRWALDSAAGRGGRRRPGPRRTPGLVGTAYGRTVIAAAHTLPYGESVHAKAYLTHTVDVLYHAWRRGRIVGALVRWTCGSTTNWFRLVAEPTKALCPMCLLRQAGVAIAITTP